MISGGTARHAAVRWLTAQSLLFGAMAALLGIVANAMFLDAYGSGWLPLTYIAIGAAGVGVSAILARSARRFDLVQLAVAVLGGAAVGIGISWLIAARGDGAWVSAPLLVLFPILIQLGFVFIGGQAGRILDIAGMKASFPRIAAGFPVGAVVGGLAGGPLVGLLGRTEHLLLVTALVQGAFAAMVWATGRRYASVLVRTTHAEPVATGGPSAPDAGDSGDRSLGRLLRSPFVSLLLAYQVLSALGSQVSDFLVFDRATAHFTDAADLARFVAGYTAVMNGVAIGFLVLGAGPLLRRFGLRLGIAANPLVMTVFAVGMIAVLAASGAASIALLAVVSAGRIADIALTDGTTRTSINAMYQVLPQRARFAAQAAVEGMGVPIAIGASGVLILVLRALPMALTAVIVVLAALCAAWTWAGVLLYRAYGPALVDALRQRRVLGPDGALEAAFEDASVAHRLLVSGDPRSARLGLEMSSAMSSLPVTHEVVALAEDGRSEVRIAALAGLVAAGDATLRPRLAAETRAAAASHDPAERVQAAVAVSVLDTVDREAVGSLLNDEVVEVRNAALDSVAAGDSFAVEPAVHALDDPRSAAPARRAIGRVGDAALPALARVLDSGESSRVAGRLVQAVTTASPARDDVLRRHAGHRDRELRRRILERLAGPGPASPATVPALDEALREAVVHGVRILGASVAISTDGSRNENGDASLLRALDDELALVREMVVAGLMARHGRDTLGPAIVRLATGGPGAAVAAEALEVVIGASGSRSVAPLLDPALRSPERLARLRPADATRVGLDAQRWIRDLVEDPDDEWRSPWLRACAIRAANRRGLRDRFDLASAAAVHDAIVDEELHCAGGRRHSHRRGVDARTPAPGW